jgi:hypothetical protein
MKIHRKYQGVEQVKRGEQTGFQATSQNISCCFGTKCCPMQTSSKNEKNKNLIFGSVFSFVTIFTEMTCLEVLKKCYNCVIMSSSLLNNYKGSF